MSAPTRTTFEVKISNKLDEHAVFVQVQAELNYATRLSSSFNDNISTNVYNKESFDHKTSNSLANAKLNFATNSQSNANQHSFSNSVADYNSNNSS
eukprot:64696_1